MLYTNRILGIGMLALFVSLALSAAPVLAQTPTARQKPTTAGLGAAKAKSQRPASPSDDTQEGIKVHGHWTIVVRNEDGSVASRHEFQNALAGRSDLLLAFMLARQASVNRWEVSIAGIPLPVGPPLTVSLIEDGTPTFGTLQVSVPLQGLDLGTLVLSGSVRWPSRASIQLVGTAVRLCTPPAIPSLSCSPGVTEPFTVKDVALQNIVVEAGQTIDVKVRISFS